MEALKVSEQVDNWNDDRLDELAQGVKEGFANVDARFDKVDARFASVDARFEKVDARFDKIEGDMKAGFKRVDERFEKTPTREEMNEGFAGLRSDFAALNRTLIASAVVIVGALIGSVVTLVATHAA